MAVPTGLIRSTWVFIKILWICALVMVPVAMGVLALTLLKGLAWFQALPIKIRMNSGVELTDRNLQLAAIGLLVGVLLVIPMLRHLLRIIDSALVGDPFIPDNARRLRNIGWLLLGWNLFSMVIRTAATTRVVEGSTIVTFPPVSITGLLGLLLIFVLAQIFKHGSSMRTELQETV